MLKNIFTLFFSILTAVPVFGEFVVKESRELLATPESNGAHVAFLTPGTPVKILETQGGFAKISVTFGLYNEYSGWLESSQTFLTAKKPEYHDAYPTQAGKGIVLVRTPLYEDDNDKPGRELGTVLKPGQFITLRKNAFERRDEEKLYDYIPISLGASPSRSSGQGVSQAVGVRSSFSAKSGWIRADHCLSLPLRDGDDSSGTDPMQPARPDSPGNPETPATPNGPDTETVDRSRQEQDRMNEEKERARRNNAQNSHNPEDQRENADERSAGGRPEEKQPVAADPDSTRKNKTVKPVSAKQIPFDRAAALRFAAESERKNPCGVVLESVDPKAKAEQQASADNAHRAAHMIHAGIEATFDEKDTKKARGFSPRKTITTPLGCGWYEQPLETDAKSLFSAFFRPKSRQFENITEVKPEELIKKTAGSYLAFGRSGQRVFAFDSLAEGYTVNDRVQGETAVVESFDEIFLIDDSSAGEIDRKPDAQREKTTSTTGRKPTSEAPSSGTGIRQSRRTASPD